MEYQETGKLVKRKWLRRILCGILAMCVGALMGAFAVYRSLQWVPQFYEQKLVESEASLAEHGEEMEQHVLDLHEDVHDEGQWQAVFSDDEINGWLAVDLKEEFPHLLPYRVHDPRVSISEQAAQIACQYKSPDLTVVLSMDVDAFVTPEPNVVGLRIQRARIGAVPGLVKMAKEEITRAARRSRIKLRWDQQNGDDVAMVTIPSDVVMDGHQVFIEKIELHDGEVHLAGRSEQIANDDSATIQVTTHQDKASLRKKRQL